jgi:hypothetical protein
MPQDISSLDKPQLVNLCTVLLEMALKNEKGAIFGIFIEKECDENLVSELGCAAHIRFEANISEYEAKIYSLRSE